MSTPDNQKPDNQKPFDGPRKFKATVWKQGSYRILRIDKDLLKAVDIPPGTIVEVVMRPVAPGEISKEEANALFEEPQQ
jgi:hypothetical protein